MGTVLLLAIALSYPILSFIFLLLVVGLIFSILDIVIRISGGALDAARARVKKLFTKIIKMSRTGEQR